MGTKALLSVLDLERTPRPMEGGGWELDEGELVRVSPNSLQQFDLIFRLYSILRDFVRSKGLGRVVADTWFELPPHTVRAPDVAFIPADRLAGIDPRHVLRVLPSLVVEVLGPSQSARDVSRRVQQYREAGITLIWVVDPERLEVDVYGDGPLRTLALNNTLDAAAILPGFTLPLSQLFVEGEW